MKAIFKFISRNVVRLHRGLFLGPNCQWARDPGKSEKGSIGTRKEIFLRRDDDILKLKSLIQRFRILASNRFIFNKRCAPHRGLFLICVYSRIQ